MSDADDADLSLDAYPPEIAALLDDARPIERAPDSARVAVKAKVLATVGASAGGAVAASAKVAPASSWWAAIAMIGVVIAAVMALRAPSSSHRAHESEPTALAPDARSTVQSALEAPPTATPPSSIPPVSAVEDAAAPARAHAAPDAGGPGAARAQDPADSLAEEQRLLDQARGALAAHEADRAMSALSQHARRYARGVLSMEREALRVRALLAADRREEARATADRFVARWPSSALRSAVEAMVR